jgi:hypothetical protein
MKVPLSSLDESIAGNTRAIKFLAWAMLFGFTLFTSAYLQVNQLYPAARYLFYAVVLIFFLMIQQGRSNRRKRRKAPHPPMVIRRGRK